MIGFDIPAGLQFDTAHVPASFYDRLKAATDHLPERANKAPRAAQAFYGPLVDCITFVRDTGMDKRVELYYRGKLVHTAPLEELNDAPRR